MSEIMGQTLDAVARDADALVAEKMQFETELDFLIAIRTRPGAAGQKLIRREFPKTSQPFRSLEQRMGYLQARLKDAEDCYKIQRMVDTLYTRYKAVTLRMPITIGSVCQDLAAYQDQVLPQVKNPEGTPETLVTRFNIMAGRLQERRAAYVNLWAPEENLQHLENIVAPLARAIFYNEQAMWIGGEKFDNNARTILAEFCLKKDLHFDFRHLCRFPPPGQFYLPAPRP